MAKKDKKNKRLKENGEESDSKIATVNWMLVDLEVLCFVRY